MEHGGDQGVVEAAGPLRGPDGKDKWGTFKSIAGSYDVHLKMKFTSRMFTESQVKTKMTALKTKWRKVHEEVMRARNNKSTKFVEDKKGTPAVAVLHVL